MRTASRFLLPLLLLAPCAQVAIGATVTTTRLEVSAGTEVKDLSCPWRFKPARPPAAADPDPQEMPNEEDIAAELEEAPGRRATVSSRLRPFNIPVDGTFKVAIWGDSHLAAGFFNEELVRLLGVPSGKSRSSLIPATMNRAGVRLPLRAWCVSPQWKYEPAYANASGADKPGPGLVNLATSEAGAELRFDLRNAAGTAELKVVRLLQQQSAVPLRLSVSVDEGPEMEVTLEGPPGPAALELVSSSPMSVLRIRLREGQFRFHGLELRPPTKPALQMDVFGYPGATVAGWKTADMDYLSSWFARDAYDLVMLEFGTNEGNVSPFDPGAYAQLLGAAVSNMRAIFPGASCVLIAPGDRGVLVRRSNKLNRKRGKSAPPTPQRAHGKASIKSVAKARGPRAQIDAQASARSGNLLKYSWVHEDIGRMQQEVAAQAGCQVWSAFDAMGGRGSAYAWAREKPALMAPDLIHFTVRGYQRLAQEFASSMGWNATTIWSRPASSMRTTPEAPSADATAKEAEKK